MITAYFADNPVKQIEIDQSNLSLLKDAMWIDLFSPTEEEKLAVEKSLSLCLPTKADMHEIELSSRLYREGPDLIMTAMVLANSGSETPQYEPVTFILTDQQMITLRYIEPLSFKLLNNRIMGKNFKPGSAASIFILLLDSAADRLADIFELLAHRLSEYSKNIFAPKTKKNDKNYHLLLRKLGAIGMLNSNARESLETFARLISFFSQEMSTTDKAALGPSLDLISEDIKSLNEHVSFISSEVNFMLNATLGMINIEQNDIIKIFSIMAVIFLPPTLVATIYGMNFQHMPELSWSFGYPFALGLIILTAWLPYIYFKIRKWL